jgi:predicted enzyme related to lactoylglutathione lyase
MAIAVTGIDIHTYLVKDADRAIAFWRDTMGLDCTWAMPGMGAEFELPDGSSFGLWKMEDGSWMSGNGVMFAVPDVAAALAELKAKGVTVHDAIDETPMCTMAFAEDTEGNRFVLHKRKT